MKIAITGHSAGIGQALAKIYERQGHEVVGLSRRNGYNIKSLHKIVPQIEICDVFINNAQSGFAQTELLFEIWSKWKDQNKTIIVISTMMTDYPISHIPNLDMYLIQKETLEETVKQLRGKFGKCKLILVKPGKVATQEDGQGVDPDVWAQAMVDIISRSDVKIMDVTIA
jgi:NADP-dependent 3-hydroxy acid dehydrogenase YdfG